MKTYDGMSEHEILGVLRNPYGIPDDIVREARRQGADLLEKRGRAIRELRTSLAERGVDLNEFDQFFKGAL